MLTHEDRIRTFLRLGGCADYDHGGCEAHRKATVNILEFLGDALDRDLVDATTQLDDSTVKITMDEADVLSRAIDDLVLVNEIAITYNLAPTASDEQFTEQVRHTLRLRLLQEKLRSMSRGGTFAVIPF